MTRTDLFYGGPCYIAGYCPTGEDSLYAYIVEDAQDRSAPDARASSWRRCASSPQAYHGPWDEIRETLDRPDPGQLHLVRDPRPATRRGTAAASCSSATPPTPARPPSPRAPRRRSRTPPSSPSCCSTATPLDQDLWDAFTARRFERAKTVVEASNQLGQWLLDHEQGDVPA